MSPYSSNGRVVLILHANTDAGYRIAHILLRAGCRVAVTGRHATDLCRIIHGYSASQVMAIAADSSDGSQLTRVIEAAQHRFDAPVTTILDARTDPPRASDDDGLRLVS